MDSAAANPLKAYGEGEAISTGVFGWNDPLRLECELGGEERDLRDAFAAEYGLVLAKVQTGLQAFS